MGEDAPQDDGDGGVEQAAMPDPAIGAEALQQQFDQAGGDKGQDGGDQKRVDIDAGDIDFRDSCGQLRCSGVREKITAQAGQGDQDRQGLLAVQGGIDRVLQRRLGRQAVAMGQA